METQNDVSFLKRAKLIFARKLRGLQSCCSKNQSGSDSEKTLHFENRRAKDTYIGIRTTPPPKMALSPLLRTGKQFDLNNEDEIENWRKFLVEYEPAVENFGLLKRVHCLESLYEENKMILDRRDSLSDSDSYNRNINPLHSTLSSLFRPILPFSPIEMARALAERKRALGSASSSTTSSVNTFASTVGSDSGVPLRSVKLRHLRRRNKNRERDLAMTLNSAAQRYKFGSRLKTDTESTTTTSTSMTSDLKRWERWRLQNKIVGFLRRTSHLSLTSDFSSDASFYLIGKPIFVFSIF